MRSIISTSKMRHLLLLLYMLLEDKAYAKLTTQKKCDRKMFAKNFLKCSGARKKVRHYDLRGSGP